LHQEETTKPIEDLAHWLWLTKVPGFGPYRFKTLLTLFENDLTPDLDKIAFSENGVEGI